MEHQLSPEAAREWERERLGGSLYRVDDYPTKAGPQRRWAAQLRARDHSGKVKTYRSMRATTKAQAKRELDRLREKARAAKVPPQAKVATVTLSDYLDAWHKQRVEDGTIRTTTERNELAYIKRWKGLLGAREVRSIVPADVEQALEYLRTGDLKGKRRALQVAYRTLRKALSDVRPRLESNPCDAVDRPTVPKPETRAFTPDELRRVLKAADQPREDSTVVDETFAALVHFLAGTGVRIGEALALSWADVDLDGAEVHIRKTLVRVKGAGTRRSAPKTPSAVRTIPLSATLVSRLRALRGTLGAIPHGTAPVFASERGGPLHGSNVMRRAWHPLLRELGLSECGFHRLRHSFASTILQAGIDIGTVSKMLGHASPAITLAIYAHFVPGREREAADAMAAVLGAS